MRGSERSSVGDRGVGEGGGRGTEIASQSSANSAAQWRSSSVRSGNDGSRSVQYQVGHPPSLVKCLIGSRVPSASIRMFQRLVLAGVIPGGRGWI